MRRQFFIKLSNQGQFQNPQEKQIPKLSLVVRFDKELMEILTVKEKASVFEVSTFFCRRVYNLSYSEIHSLFLENHGL